jgi:hypothetical protein
VLVVIAVFAGPNKHGVSKAAVPKIKVNNRTVQCAWKVRCYIKLSDARNKLLRTTGI